MAAKTQTITITLSAASLVAAVSMFFGLVPPMSSSGASPTAVHPAQLVELRNDLADYSDRQTIHETNHVSRLEIASIKKLADERHVQIVNRLERIDTRQSQGISEQREFQMEMLKRTK